MKPSVVYETGERIYPDMVQTVPMFTKYARQELGLSLPVGNGRRQGWMKFCKDEMEEQGWRFEDLTTAVRFIKSKHKKCDTLYGILWYVKQAREWDRRARDFDPTTSLHLKVAAAIQQETDEEWVRKLALADGRALELVYEGWLRFKEGQ